ncbi:amino acid ABC transporter permease [Bradyrhizobium canariense]|uniref:amino acid ABC transporter permease n=1 Tax=Bradyrhizobium canariense TaxID=255045 RepID=UPI001C6767C4|nr:amino acid ABC transporter permease [Bradyrhizobium canariense]MBW5435728.1 amino acid ABC transporter permease [Bradyrhizobium canariense]
MQSINIIIEYLMSPAFRAGAIVTLEISICGLVGGLLIGLFLALLQQSAVPGERPFRLFYLWFFRGTPVLFQVIFIFNVLPAFGIVLSGFSCAVLGLALNEGANMSEILRSGLQSTVKGQRLAARALGMDEFRILKLVVFPQAMRVVLPPIGNEFINMLRLSALVSVIAVQELTLVANQAASSSFHYLEALSAAGIYYLAITTIFMALQHVSERWADPRSRRQAVRNMVLNDVEAT